MMAISVDDTDQPDDYSKIVEISVSLLGDKSTTAELLF